MSRSGAAATYALSYFDGSQDDDVAATDIIRPRDRQGGDQVPYRTRTSVLVLSMTGARGGVRVRYHRPVAN